MHTQGRQRSPWDRAGQLQLKTTVVAGSSILRRALRLNVVSFPAQIPVLLKQPTADMQWRMVLLYFVRGWSQTAIAARYGVPVHRISRSLNEWCIRALAFGYVQVIDREECGRLGLECGTDAPDEEVRAGGGRAVIEMAPAPVDWPGKGAEMVASLDAAIAQCERWSGGFWEGASALLADLRTAATIAVERGRPNEPRAGLLTVSRSAKNSGRQRVRVRDEERVSHAVA